MSVVFWDLDDVNNLIIQTRTNRLYVVEICKILKYVDDIRVDTYGSNISQ